MDKQAVAKQLKKLMQLDIDAVRAYEQALDHIKIAALHTAISQFRDDHQRHITELSAAIRELGEEPPTISPDLKGLLIEVFTTLRSVTGTEGALKAMKSNEKLTNRDYHNALGIDSTPEIKALIEKNYADEQRHLAYIEQALATKPWDASGVPHR